MTAPPGLAPNHQPTGGLVSDAVYHSAAAAIRRAGIAPTRSRVRAVVRAQQATGEQPVDDFDFWDRLVRALPFGASRKPHVKQWQVGDARGPWAVSS